MTLRALHRLSVSRNQPVIVVRKSWDLDFKARIAITPSGRWWVKKKDGSRFEARFTAQEWMARDWVEVSLCENLQTDTSPNTQEDLTAPL